MKFLPSIAFAAAGIFGAIFILPIPIPPSTIELIGKAILSIVWLLIFFGAAFHSIPKDGA